MMAARQGSRFVASSPFRLKAVCSRKLRIVDATQPVAKEPSEDAGEL